MKLTKKQINKIQKLKEKGKSCKEVSDILEINYSQCFYHYNQEYRKEAIKKQIIYNKENIGKMNKERYRNYQKKYHSEYYHSTENHERLKEYHRNYQNKRYAELKNKKLGIEN